MKRTIAIACTTAIMAALAAPSFAQQAFPEEREVYVGDLDTYSARGADAALNRVHEASEEICGDRPGPMPIPERQGIEACTYETMEIAVAESGNSVLHQRYYGYEPEIIIEDDGVDGPYYGPKG